MKKITYAQISAAVREQCPNGYNMSLVGDDAELVEFAVNQGIDAHLEACYIKDRGDQFEWQGPRPGTVGVLRLESIGSAESLPVLLRRLLETPEDLFEVEDDGYNARDQAERLVCDILSTLEIHVDSGCFEIVSPVDEPTEEENHAAPAGD